LKKVNKENKILKLNKKNLTPEDHLKNQKKNLGKKINKKLEEVKKLEDVHYESIDYAELNKIHTQRKKLESKLKKASQVVIPEKKKKVNKSNKIELVTTKWYQKYHWWYTKNGFLVIGGKSAKQNEEIVKTYMKDSDYYFHTDEAGSGSFILISENGKPEEIDLNETAQGVLALSEQWNSSFISGDVYHVMGDQVSKTPNTGEYIKTGSFIIRGKRNYISISECILGYGLYNNQLMLAPYGIINRLEGSKVKIEHSN
jgi:Predicted RNA-binding protein homologous to eukaryotic snRNP